jgi:hypothetical protein
MNTKLAAGASTPATQSAECGGVWIDHRRAIIVALTAGGAQVSELPSQVEKHPQRGGDSPLKGAYEARQVPPDDRRQNALTGELNGYYDKVIAALADFGRVLILGPGEAKQELRARLAHHKLAGRISALEAEDKMSEPQIVAKVRSHFGVEAPRQEPR